MLSTWRGVAADPGRAGAEPGAGRQSNGQRGAQIGDERRQGLGVQEWSDGSRYEGEFVNGFKHGNGRYTWRNGEYYEGSFYKDYRHGDGLYCWPTGHKFTGKFYLNRKEGYGQQLFPDGVTFQGLYHADQRFGPGVVSYPDGRKDVGLWLGDRLLKLCTSVEEGFSLKNFPEYAAYMDPATTTDSLTQAPTNGPQTEARTDSEVDTDRDLLSDENFILPTDIESYSTDGDHLPLPPGRRRELDQHFYGELWVPDAYPHQGYERDPLSTLPLQARMQAHIHKHRLHAENVEWDVAAVLSLSRENFGPKGPLEVSSELLIQHASRGELQAVSQILQTGLVHPDVTDSQGHTAMIAATINCHNDVIQLLLDMGADIDKLNCEGMSALAVCHVLYYPFQSLHTTLAEPPANTQVLRSPSACWNSPQISQVDFNTDTPRFNNRPQTTDTTLSNQSHLSDQTAEELTEHILHHSSIVPNDKELITECSPDLNQSETPADTEDQQEEERKEKEGEEMERDWKGTEGEGKVREREDRFRREDEKESKGEEREIECRCDQTWEIGESELKEKEREFKKREKNEEDVELGERRDTESRKENMEVREEVEEDVEKGVRNIHEEDVKEREERGSEDVPGVERSIQVLDGHIALGSVQWKECRAKTAGRVQGNDKELTQKPTFDSACSVSSYNIQVTEEVMQRSAEALSRTGIPQRSDTQETVRKMAAMKTEHRVRLNTLQLLLERGADPNVSRVPMLALFLAIMAADAEAVKRLLLCGARTDIPLPPEKKGLYPLHVAAALPGPAGPRITELLLHAVTDPDAQACDQNEIYEPDKIFMKAQEPLSTNKSSHLKEGGRTALHVACQRDSDYRNASKVVALLLSHRASTDLLWSGHSPLSLAIATGNDLAVEELLNGGTNPNIPLGCRVGSALCALANINYHLGGNRAKLLDMLAKAGADILMPVTVGDVVGTAVDYAYYSFNQDLCIANTPFHALNMRERETFKARRQLLSMMGDLLRHTADQRERENLEREHHLTMTSTSSTERFVYMGAGAIASNVPLPSCESLPPITEKHRKPVFKFCYHCGRSVSVKLTACSRCHKVFYCSGTCKLKAWNERHKEECIRVSASSDGIQKNVVFKSQRGPRPLAVMLKTKTVPRPMSVKLKSQRVPQPLSMAEKVLESQVNLKENYSYN
ncbi:ankyrin repeat and MYND domain-containing protein 1 isoform X2 [Siniperca chuatsi]|uniref:ankyrin repeat and MYND domain-containing protein 1 isoform X2 n=1 Tax=Siniperca chuatsi TaxID=119488 RepID=UPI001CE05188|nr:ankyrin repeat and MYND domain-containing protein 1 isoform X2 [Siniperca chuatsi]